MTSRLMRLVMFGALCSLIAACSNSSNAKFGGEESENPTAPVDIGEMLFKPASWPRYEDIAVSDPIRVSLVHLTVLDKVELPSKEEGTVEWLGVEVPAGEVVDPKDLHVHKRTQQRYKRLRLGEPVSSGQVIVVLDDERAALEHDISINNTLGAEKEFEAAKEAVGHHEANLKIEEKANSSLQNIIAARASLGKAVAERGSKEYMVKRAEGEQRKSKFHLDSHYIRAPFNGNVVQFQKQVGEGVRVTDPILMLQNFDRLGVEGYLDVQYANKVKPGSKVYLEPAILESPLPARSPHMSSRPITSVAVGMFKGKQVILSASEDGIVHVWDRETVHKDWKHPGAVRCLAATRPGNSASLALTGCDDGKARIWSLDRLDSSPVTVLDGHHEGGVQAVAFAPDGAHCLTADDRGDIYLWNVSSGKKDYTFPHEHNSSVTALHFTPQCRAISAGRDNVAFVWKVGAQAAAVESTFDHRSGEVSNLGVSDDGGQMLLDLDKNRLRVIGLEANRNLGTLQQASENKFATMALFSPTIGKNKDIRVILTGTGVEGVLQLWRWGGGAGQGAEAKKLVCDNYVGASCAAFSPTARDGFIVVGTRKGDVHLWPIPSEEELATRFTARITHIDPSLESSGKARRIFAEFKNPDDAKLRLRPGTTATMVIPQD